jgi:psiF repeat
MLQRAAALSLVVGVGMILSMPVAALTSEQKLKTCNFSADHQKLSGAARESFLSKCMADEDRPTSQNKLEQQK